jgi:serine/threonine protein kinase
MLEPNNIIGDGAYADVYLISEDKVIKSSEYYNPFTNHLKEEDLEIIKEKRLRHLVKEQFKQKYFKRNPRLAKLFVLSEGVTAEGNGIIYPRMKKTLGQDCMKWQKKWSTKKTFKNKYRQRDIMRKSLKLVKKLHDQGFLHGDLLMMNIMMSKHGKEVKLIDAGSFKPVPSEKEKSDHEKVLEKKVLVNNLIPAYAHDEEVHKALEESGLLLPHYDYWQDFGGDLNYERFNQKYNALIDALTPKK